jgi:hypothetical protein
MPETRIKSLPAAAFVLAKGAKLLRCESGGSDRVEFIFDDPQSSIESTAREFFSGESAPARDFYRALQDVRFAVNRTLSRKGGAR